MAGMFPRLFWWGSLLMLAIIYVGKGDAVKCHECAVSYDAVSAELFVTPTGGCWDQNFNSATSGAVDCPNTCITHRITWSNKEHQNFAVRINRRCGNVGPEMDFSKCSFTGEIPDVPSNVSYTNANVFCCANDYCNGFPNGPKEPFPGTVNPRPPPMLIPGGPASTPATVSTTSGSTSRSPLNHRALWPGYICLLAVIRMPFAHATGW